MIAVVYSGSRYATWKLADKGVVVSEFKIPGINPFFSDERSISFLLNKTNALVTYAEKIRKIYFFGAGASSPERKKLIASAFESFFRFGKVYVEHDVKAAAIATCGDMPGLVGILGSGTNAAYYNGRSLKNNNNGLGYILNDEGSANWLGRRLLKDFLNDTLPHDLKQQFTKRYGLERKQILDKVYKHSQPILFLTSFSDFFLENTTAAYVEDTVKKGFRLCFDNYIRPLVNDHPDVSLHFAGTVAFGFADWLKQVAEENELQIASIIMAPIDNVVRYYVDRN
jgi:hypothetical protein